MVSNKSRLLRLYRYLYVNTDDRHFTTKAEIMKALKDQETIYSRQTVRDDIDTLAKEGYDIETIVSSGNYYYFGDREFTLEELRLMADAVASSRFIGKKQKAAIKTNIKMRDAILPAAFDLAIFIGDLHFYIESFFIRSLSSSPRTSAWTVPSSEG